MNIKEIARDAIVPEVSIPEKRIWIDVINVADWDGNANIYITAEPTKEEDSTQMGIVCAVTILGIHTIASTREKADDIERTAVSAMYAKFSEMEQQRGSGILCIMCQEHNTTQRPDREDAFQATFLFRVTHKL
jgi:hypothetical protein